MNISTPVTTSWRAFSWMPTSSTVSPVLTMPRSMRPVATVPRPLMPKTSSIGIRNGFSVSRAGVGMYESTASISSLIEAYVLVLRVVAGRLERLERRAADDGDVVAGELVLGEELAHLHLDEVDEHLVVDHVDLVEVDDEARHLDLAGQEDVLARLGHRAVGGGHDQDRAVHLGGAGDHVLDVVGVAGAVDVRVVAVRRLVLDVADGDRDAALPLLGSVVDRVEGAEVRAALTAPGTS